MKRTVALGMLLGLLNAAVAIGVFVAVEQATVDAVGWFAYAPLEDVGYDLYGVAYGWEYLAVPASLILLNAVLLPMAVARGWLRRR